MNARSIRVFVSSVSGGLENTRNQIIQDLRKAAYDVSAMEQFGAQPSVPLDVCLNELRKADALVLLIGPRYGSVLPQGISYTHAEFREAQGLGIPIFAIRVPDDPHLGADERTKLDSFSTEVGGTTTYDALAAGEALERVSPRVLAALSSARDRGDIGSRYSVFQRYERYFAPELAQSGALFSHEGPFIGRQQQLERLHAFIDGAEPLLLLKAPGGSGKSRLLLEAARSASGRSGTPVFFADSAASWSAADINLLPRTSAAVVVFDDGHRRPDLDRIIAACRQHNDAVRYLVSCRPSAVALVTPLVSSLLASGDPPELDLPPLAKLDAEALARHYLGDSFHELAARLVAVADRNPLVVRVGARCIAEHRVLPEVLERTPEVFRRVVLNRLLDDPALTSSNAAANRRILEVVSAIGPVVTENDELVKQLADIAGLPDHEVRRLLATLERAKFLLRRGRVVRVSPDVLADHLLYIAAVDDLGRPTGFVDRMVAVFGSSLENILANAAELDWRSETVDGPDSVLRAVWRDLLERLPTFSYRQRDDLARQLKRAAIFAPVEVVRICQWLVGHPDAPEDEALVGWGLEDSPDRSIDAITELLGLIATHPDFTKRCTGMLWSLGDRDDRPENPNPNHPRRQLADLLKYEPRTGWRSPDGPHARAVEFLIERLHATSRNSSSVWAVSALAGALRRTGEDNQWNRRVFTLREFSLARFAPELAARRTAIIRCLVAVALGDKLDEAATALSGLSTTLSAPRGPFGRGLDDEEVAVWHTEADSVIGHLKEVANLARSDVIRFLARRELRAVHQDHWPQIATAIQKALEDVPAVPSERLYDLLIGAPWQEQLDDWTEEEARVERLSTDAAQAFWQAHGSPSSAVDGLLAAIAAFHGVGRQTESRTGQLVRALVLTSPHDRRDFIQQLVAREPAWPLLRSALLAVHEVEPALAETLVRELSQSEHALVRASAVDAIQWMIDRAADLASLVDVARTVSQDASLIVRAATARVSRRLAKHSDREALSILTSIDWSDDLQIADEVFRSIDPQYGVDPDRLADADIDTLLRRIELLKTLEGRNYEVLEFINFASGRRPSQTLAMLLRRVLATDARQVDKSEERGVPLPYSGRGLSLLGIQQASDNMDLVRSIRDATPSAGSSARFWLPILFHAADPNLVAARTVLREWLSSGEAERIVATATLLRGFAHSIVFTDHELIADIIVAASQCGSECLDDTKGELFALAASGVYSGTPGQPAPRHVQDRKDASALVELYTANEPVRDFYAALVAHADANMRLDVELWDEGDDE